MQNKLKVIQDEIIALKSKLQKEVPNSLLVLDKREWIKKGLLDIKKKYNEILSAFQLIEGDSKEISPSKEDVVMDVDPSSILILVCRKAIEEKLKEISSVKFDILQTGGPLDVESYKKINPSIPVKAMVNIEKKIKKTFDEISKRASGKAHVILLGIANNEVDSLFLNSITEVALKTGGDTMQLALKSIDDINAETIIKSISTTIEED